MEIPFLVKCLPTAFVPLTVLVAASVFYFYNNQKLWFEHGLRASIVVGILFTICWALAGTLLLSAFTILNFPFVFTWWLVGVLLLFSKGGTHSLPKYLREVGNAVKNGLLSLNMVSIGVWFYVVAVLFVAFVMAVFSPPNNNDSMFYHLPRQILWMSNASVFITEAPNIFMLKWPPLSEYLGVNLWILSDSDRFHNLVQWSFLVASLVVLSMILEHLGACRGIAIALAMVVSVPAIFYQASNTKNDILVGFLLLCMIWLTEEAVKRRVLSWPIAILTGICVGCAMMAKGTALVYLSILFPFLFLIRIIKNKVTFGFAPIVVAVFISCLIASSHYVRHTQDILEGDAGENSEHTNSKINIPNAFSVLSKNIALQMALPNDAWNKSVEGLIESLHKQMGVEVNSLETSFHENPFTVIYWSNSEDNVTSIIYISLILMLAVIGVCLAMIKKRLSSLYFILPLILLFGFSALLKWQPWHTRLIIPIEMIAGVPIGMFFAGIRPQWANYLIVGLSAWWLFPCLKGWHRPLLGSQPVYTMNDLDQRSMKAPREAFDTIAMASILAQLKPSSININASFYPPLLYAGRDSWRWPKIHVSSDNVSQGDVIMRTITPGQELPAPGEGMQRLYQSDYSYLDINNQLIDVAGEINLPAFTGLKNISGMEEPIGPFPLAKQPVFCHAHYPEVTFDIPTQSKPGLLKLEMALPYFHKLDENMCEIFVNDQKLGEIELKKVKKGKRIFSETVSIPAGDSLCRVRLKFQKFAPDSDSKIAASITGIQFTESNESTRVE